MNYIDFLEQINVAAECQSEEMFVGKVDCLADTVISEKAMHIIYVAANGKFKELVGDRSLAAFSRDFNIPYRTLQWWCTEERKSPLYVKYLIAFALLSELEK